MDPLTNLLLIIVIISVIYIIYIHPSNYFYSISKMQNINPEQITIPGMNISKNSIEKQIPNGISILDSEYGKFPNSEKYYYEPKYFLDPMYWFGGNPENRFNSINKELSIPTMLNTSSNNKIITSGDVVHGIVTLK